MHSPSSPPQFVSRTIFSQGRARRGPGDGDSDEEEFMNEENYHKILLRKGEMIRELLIEFAEEFEVIPSPRLFGFRQRCRFGVMENELGDLEYSIWELGQNTMIKGYFDVASESMNNCMEVTKRLLNSERFSLLRSGLNAINFHENRNGTEILCTLCSGRPLPQCFSALAGELASELGIKAVIGRARKERVVSAQNGIKDDAFVVEHMEVRCSSKDEKVCRSLSYIQPEGSFSNPNADIAEVTANWLCDLMRRNNIKAQHRKFVEFYCGNANHGCYLADFFTQVIGVEIDNQLCAAARDNLKNNGIENGLIINKPAEEVARINHGFNFDHNDFLLVDPPRAGLDSLTLHMAKKFQSVIYIACDARSLVRDLREKDLGKTHKIKHMAAFDHFPWHAQFLEVVCWLEKIC